VATGDQTALPQHIFAVMSANRSLRPSGWRSIVPGEHARVESTHRALVQAVAEFGKHSLDADVEET